MFDRHSYFIFLNEHYIGSGIIDICDKTDLREFRIKMFRRFGFIDDYEYVRAVPGHCDSTHKGVSANFKYNNGDPAFRLIIKYDEKICQTPMNLSFVKAIYNPKDDIPDNNLANMNLVYKHFIFSERYVPMFGIEPSIKEARLFFNGDINSDYRDKELWFCNDWQDS